MHPGFAGVVQNDVAAAARLGQAPERLDELERRRRCPASARRSPSDLRALGLGSVRDLLLHRPRRYERAVDEIAISQLWGDDEVAIAGEVVDVRMRRTRRPAARS